mmetsp:Transcript_36036/g.84689  ORF Transcript_36036/g.84689 Transcript_36036/m.84689 type:complete len:408 (-) Transcript_36036:235-1458(-)
MASPTDKELLANDDAKERGVKYVWNEDADDWDAKRVKIIMQEEPYKEGGMRVAHRIWEIEGGQVKAGIAKYFKEKDISPSMCFNEAMTQMLADAYAVRFNESYESTRKIRFVPVSVLRLSERSGQIVSVEPFIAGRYVKHNDNDGHVDTDDILPQAFSHFTWEESRRKLLVCDIQGVGDCYTDPQIHSVDGEGFGTGNMGLNGIQKFFSTHKCNAICKMLQLHGIDPFAKRDDDESEEMSQSMEGSFRAGTDAGAPRVSEERGRRHRRQSADEGSQMSLSGVERQKTGKSKNLKGLWNSGKAFGAALVRAVKASVISPQSSRSVSPVSGRQRGNSTQLNPDAIAAGLAAAKLGQDGPAPPQVFRRNRAKGAGVPASPPASPEASRSQRGPSAESSAMYLHDSVQEED